MEDVVKCLHLGLWRLMAEALQLPSGENAIIGPIPAWDYYRKFIPVCSQIENGLQTFGDWASAIIDDEFKRIVDIALSCLPRIDKPDDKLTVSLFGESWYFIPEIFEELIPRLHKMPELEFRKLTLRQSAGSSGDAFADLLYSTAESLGTATLKQVDIVTLHRNQWLANQSAYSSLPLSKLDELAQAERMDKVRDDAKKAKAQQAATLAKIAEKRRIKNSLEKSRISDDNSTAS